MNAYDIIKHPLATEKAIRLMEAENKLVFVVSRKATKEQIKKAVAELFKSKVSAVNVHNTHKGVKRAYVTFAADTPAIDVATDLGVL
ncbi:50S ribosomal protein L23 [Candidatus Woesearchaeota archaeon]|nr:50S ribosomal protein L23 [Candidatus Woesearchaeota archaeon]